MFYFIGSIVLFLLVFILFFTVKSIHNIDVIKNMKNKFLSWVVSIIPVGILFLLFSFINSIVILFHYIIFLIIVNLVLIIIKKNNSNLLVIITAILTVLYMGGAYYECHHIFETVYNINTNKNIGTKNFKIIQISDTHIGATFDGEGFYKKIEELSKMEADLVVITGDFIDDNTSYEDMVKAAKALSLFKPTYGVYFVNGNHDRGYYKRNYSYDDLVSELEKNNVKVLKDEVVEINDYIVLIGREDKQYNRMSIKDLTSNIDKSKYIIDLNHQPNDYDNEAGVVDLVLSGHTHGGQLFPLGIVGRIMGANDETYGLHTRSNTNFIINSGMSCWEIIFKSATHSEYVIVNINGDKNE